MIPSRGVRPSSFSSLLPRQCLHARSHASRKFSSISQRNVPLSSSPSSINPLRNSRWRTTAFTAPIIVPTASKIRFQSTNASTDPLSPQTSGLLPSSFSPSDLPPLGPDITSVPEHIGHLKELGLDYGWGVTNTIQWVLEHAHIYGGLGWGASIVVTTVLIRLAFVPLYVKQADNTARMSAVIGMTTPLRDKYTQALREGNSDLAASTQKQIMQIYRDAGASPLRGLVVPLAQMVVGVCAFRQLRAMAQLPVPGFLDGGFAWFRDLTLSDPYFILPAVTGSLMHLLTRYGGETGSATMSPGQKTVIGIVLPGVMFLVSAWLPAAVQLSFATTGVIGFIQGLVFRNAALRQFLGIAPLTRSPGPQKDPASNSLRGTVDLLGKNRERILYQAPGGKHEGAGVLKTKINEVKDWFTQLTGMAGNSVAKKRKESMKRQAEAYEKKRRDERENDRWRSK